MRRISGRHFSSAKARSRRSSVKGSKPGSARVSQPNQQGTGTTLVAVPPSICVTCIVVHGGSKRSMRVEALSSSSMRSSSPIMRPA